MSVGERLRQIRAGADLTQAEMAKLGDVHVQTQIKYEAGKRLPDAAYLMRLLAAGLDVNYVLSGKRSAPGELENFALAARVTQQVGGDHGELGQRLVEAMNSRTPPTKEEWQLLDDYRSVKKGDQKMLRELLRRLIEACDNT